MEKNKILKFTEFLNESETISGKDIVNYITRITPSESDVPDYFFKLVLDSGKRFVEKRVKIEDLLKADKALKDYVDSKENRYEDSDYEPDANDLSNPIVIFNGEVIDGYNRTSVLYHSGEDYVDAYVSL